MTLASWAILIVLILLGPAIGPTDTTAGLGNQQMAATRIAVLLDLQGNQGSLGRPAMNGFVLGLQQGSGQGPIPFSALIDTKSDPQASASAARRVASFVSLAAGFTDNDSVLIAGPVFQRAKLPFLSIGATDPALPEVIGKSIFLMPFGDNTQAAAAAEFGRQAFGRTVAILWDSTSQYSRTLPRYFRSRFEQLGGQIVLDSSYDGGCDITALGHQLAGLSRQPHFVYLAGLPDCIGSVIASLRAAGVSGPIVGGDGLDTPRLLVGASGPTSDVWFTTHAWLSEQTGSPEAKAFIAAYREAYGAAPADAFAALGYDAARLMLDVLHRASGRNGIINALEHTVNFKGVTGTVTFSAAGHVPLKTVWVIEVRNGQKRLASTIVPGSVPPPILDAP
jgi:branched-chain amino acid transport system substrate-binding protein